MDDFCKGYYEMNKMLFPTVTLLIIGLITGCGPRAIAPGAEQINVKADHNTQVSRNCKFLGQISGADIHEQMDLRSTQQDLALDDVNFLKNEGARLGANVIVFKQHQLVDKRIPLPAKHIFYGTITTHNIEGDAYLCPHDTMATFKQMKIKKSAIKDSLIMQKYTIEKSGMLISDEGKFN
jgi:hypothetical protein